MNLQNVLITTMICNTALILTKKLIFYNKKQIMYSNGLMLMGVTDLTMYPITDKMVQWPCEVLVTAKAG